MTPRKPKRLMKVKIKTKWLAALRGGNFKQTKAWLRSSEDECCCLGVLADICGTTWTANMTDCSYLKWPTWRSNYQPGPNLQFLSEDFLKTTGLTNNQQYTLARMNDSGKSFIKIANYIEKNL